MKTRGTVLRILAFWLTIQSLAWGARAASPLLRKVADIPLPGNASRFDYQSLDPSTGRLYISHMGDGHVVVFDIKTRRVLANLPGFPRVTGVLAVPQLGHVFASATGNHQVAVIDENYEGLASEEERVLPIARSLGKKPIAILPNHGAITTADSIPLALVRMLLLEGMVQRNLSVAQAARATGLKAIPIAPEAARRAKAEIARIPAIAPLWQDFLERLQKTDPDLFAVNA